MDFSRVRNVAPASNPMSKLKMALITTTWTVAHLARRVEGTSTTETSPGPSTKTKREAERLVWMHRILRASIVALMLLIPVPG